MLKEYLEDNYLAHEMAEIQDNVRRSLEIALSRNATINTANDVSIALNYAVNSGRQIDWSFAEKVLGRFSVLWTEELAKVNNVVVDSDFGKEVWMNNNFRSNLIKLLEGGDCWRVRKSLNLLLQIVGDWRDYDSLRDLSVGTKFLNSLASITLQSLRSSQEDEEMKGVYLIRKNHKKTIPCGILRLINSFLYSRKEKIIVAYNALEIISAFIDEEVSPKQNLVNFTEAPNIPKAIVKFLIEEKANNDVVELCLHLAYALVTLPNINDVRTVRKNFLKCGICKALMLIIDMYTSNNKIMKYAIYIIYLIIQDKENIPAMITKELLIALVQVFNSPVFIPKEGQNPEDYVFEDSDRNAHKGIVERLCASNDTVIEQFNLLGVPEGSSFFGLFKGVRYIKYDKDQMVVVLNRIGLDLE
jgi:hypothetical protein